MANTFRRITDEVKKAVCGKDREVVLTLLAMLAGGNVLIEDIPGVGKTTMALAFSRALGLDYGRVQFSPDTMPSDITGFSSFDSRSGKFTFNKGAVFCNLFLADELNRTSSRTQAALLEAMEERQVTVDGVSYPLEKPFFVIATQNPAGASGTQLLPDSQTDRFMIKISLGYPSEEAEQRMLLSRMSDNPLDSVRRVVDREGFCSLQEDVRNVYVDEELARYIVSLVGATRKSPLLSRGASPRATLALTEMSRAAAFASGRDFITPKDISNVFEPTLSHRIILSGDAASQRIGESAVLREILKKVKAPRI